MLTLHRRLLGWDCHMFRSNYWVCSHRVTKAAVLRMRWVCPAGLFVGGPRLFLGQQVVFGHRAPPGWPVQERDQPALPAQHRPEESHLELHPLRDRNTVSCCLPALAHLPVFPAAGGGRSELVCVPRYDDYDYGEVNQLLPRDLKLYIKAVACFPDATKTPVCPLTASERVRSPAPLHLQPFFLSPCTLLDFHFSLPQIHVNLLIMEARLQGELLYALRAITKYMIT